MKGDSIIMNIESMEVDTIYWQGWFYEVECDQL